MASPTTIRAALYAALVELAASKKFVMAILTMIAYLVGKFGFELDTEHVYGIISPLLAAIFGQGIADIGKPAAIAAARVANDNKTTTVEGATA